MVAALVFAQVIGWVGFSSFNPAGRFAQALRRDLPAACVLYTQVRGLLAYMMKKPACISPKVCRGTLAGRGAQAIPSQALPALQEGLGGGDTLPRPLLGPYWGAWLGRSGAVVWLVRDCQGRDRARVCSLHPPKNSQLVMVFLLASTVLSDLVIKVLN